MHVALTHASTNQLIHKCPRLPHLICDQLRSRLALGFGFRYFPTLLSSTYFVSPVFKLSQEAPERNSRTMITDYIFRTLALLGTAGLLYVSRNSSQAGACTTGIRGAGNAFATRNSCILTQPSLDQVLGVCAYRIWFHPLSKYPGPVLAKLSNLYSAYYAWTGDIHVDMWRCHQKYGKDEGLN